MNVKQGYSTATEEELAFLLREKRKYMTFSFDDQVIQDRVLMEIFERHGAFGTFNINCGLLGAEGRWRKFTADEIRGGCYGNHEIASHGFTHPFMTELTKEELIADFRKDAETIRELCGVAPTGLAYPYGIPAERPDLAYTLRDNTDLRYGRTTFTTHDFGLPEDFMLWHPTAWWLDPELDAVTDRFFAEKDLTENRFCFLWGHAYEIDDRPEEKAPEKLERLLTEAEKQGVVFVTNRVVYQLAQKAGEASK